ncbi:hypothetical protein L873DRAFT_1845162 [Choiromyces venosus 120613-1]|uniref:Uncharacterized protein n=1 Tax=Choiromyces venosus 120613-1 TaxID=1336337 RepID=A0A3N4JHM3_9PEZI|nr:hypothetical protein L873DRAFT_1845162 [Choiromyces venosus 120613-1]
MNVGMAEGSEVHLGLDLIVEVPVRKEGSYETSDIIVFLLKHDRLKTTVIGNTSSVFATSFNPKTAVELDNLLDGGSCPVPKPPVAHKLQISDPYHITKPEAKLQKRSKTYYTIVPSLSQIPNPFTHPNTLPTGNYQEREPHPQITRHKPGCEGKPMRAAAGARLHSIHQGKSSKKMEFWRAGCVL